LFICQSTKHFPGGVAAADRYDETAPIRHRRPGFRSDNLGSPARHRVGVGKYFDLHILLLSGDWSTGVVE
jgi:hypothetical protein